MAIPKILEDLSIIQKLSNLPNETDGLSADSLKAAFDEAPLKLQQYINEELVPYLEGENAATGIGIAAIEGVNAEDVQRALEILKAQINDATTGAIPDGSITTEKLREGSVVTSKLAEDTVTTDKVVDRAITNEKINTVSADKVTGTIVNSQIADNAVTTDKITDFNITERKLGAGSVTELKIAVGAVTRAKIASGAVSQTYTATIGTEWTGDDAPYTQTIDVAGITADDKPTVGVAYSDAYKTAEAQKEAWSMVYRIKTETGRIVVYATDKTETEIPLQLMCVRR